MRRIDLKKASAARSNTIRDINRQIVLNYVRELGPISRAEIARETALQRSTISLIVDELRVDGLIATLQRILNVEGYAVLSVDASQTIRLNLQLLREQFELGDSNVG